MWLSCASFLHFWQLHSKVEVQISIEPHMLGRRACALSSLRVSHSENTKSDNSLTLPQTVTECMQMQCYPSAPQHQAWKMELNLLTCAHTASDHTGRSCALCQKHNSVHTGAAIFQQ